MRERDAADRERDRNAAEHNARTAWSKAGFMRRHRDFAEAHPTGFPLPEGIPFERGQKRLNAAHAVIDGGGILALIGDRGVGKTQLAACHARAYVFARSTAKRPGAATALYARFDDLADAARSVFREEAEETRLTVKAAKTCGLLILDELQDRHDTAFEDRLLRNLIDHRYGDGRPTILIANLRQEALEESLGPSIVSRMQECGLVLTCDWPSFRERRAGA